MEILDIYNELGAKMGKTLPRGTTLPKGEYFLSVQVWIRNQNGLYLIQQRAQHLKSGAGMWATTAGYVLAGEESHQGAVREVQEELGIQLENLRHFERLKTDYRLEDIWLAEVSADIQPQLGVEVSAWQWVSKAKIRDMIQAGEFFAYSYFEQLP